MVMPKETKARAASTRKPRTSKKPAIAGVVPEPQVALPSAELETEIRKRAYELYLERGQAPGDPHEDWLAAEQQVKARRAAAGS
jgi:hypothetical protein